MIHQTFRHYVLLVIGKKQAKTEGIDVIQKTCKSCSETKLVSEFHNLSKSPDKKNPYCKICQNAIVFKNEEKYILYGPTHFPDKKACSSCKDIKPISQFPKNKRRRDGYHSFCKPCWRVYVIKAKRRQQMYNG
jgi:hypothetical protein